MDSEGVENSLRQDRELHIVLRVEFHRQELISLAWQLGLRDHELFRVFDVIDRDSEIRDTMPVDDAV